MSDFSASTSPEFIEALRLSMNYGYINYKQVIEWADKLLSIQTNPEEILFKISERTDGRDLSYILNLYVGDFKPANSSRIILSFINSDLLDEKITMHEAAKKLYEISLSPLKMPEIDKRFCSPYDYQFYLESAGISRPGIAREFLYKFLFIYSGYRLNNYPDWGEIHVNVNERLKQFQADYYDAIGYKLNNRQLSVTKVRTTNERKSSILVFQWLKKFFSRFFI